MKKSASDQVVEYIQKMITAGEWGPGMKIFTESRLQSETGVSKASVREAVEKLVAMDILTKRQGDGTYINDLSAGSLFQQLMPSFFLNVYDPITILDFREVMEPACVQMFIDHFDEKRYEQLQQYLKAMEIHQADTQTDEFYKADRDFHLAVAQGTGNSIVIKIMEILSTAMTGYHYTANRTIGSKSGAAEHREVLKAVANRDKELAALLMKRHIQRSNRDILEYMEKHGN